MLLNHKYYCIYVCIVTYVIILFFRGVLQSLVEKHFPAPDRNRIKKLLGNVGIELKHSKNHHNGDSQGPSSSGGSGEKRKSGKSILILHIFI